MRFCAGFSEYAALYKRCGKLISHVNLAPVTSPASKPSKFYANKFGKDFGGVGQLTLGYDVTCKNMNSIADVINKELKDNPGVRGE